MSVVLIQRVESAAIAVLVVAAFVAADYAWWWLPVLFLAFDLSALGYLRDPRFGALLYNLGHSYTVPALLAGVAVVSEAADHPLDVVGVLAGAWLFHIAADRAMGYGLKQPDAFTHTHLGLIGKARAGAKP